MTKISVARPKNINELDGRDGSTARVSLPNKPSKLDDSQTTGLAFFMFVCSALLAVASLIYLVVYFSGLEALTDMPAQFATFLAILSAAISFFGIFYSVTATHAADQSQHQIADSLNQSLENISVQISTLHDELAAKNVDESAVGTAPDVARELQQLRVEILGSLVSGTNTQRPRRGLFGVFRR